MTGELDEVIDLVAPQVGIARRWIKTALIGLAVVIVAILLGWVMWKLFFAERAAQAKHDQVQTQALIGKATAGAEAGHDAIKITVDNGKAAAAVDTAVREALHAIAQAKGADQQIDPALDDIGRRAICLRTSASSLPDCQHLQPANP